MNKEKALKNQGLEFREDIIRGGGIKLNQAGKLIQFTLDEPEYMIEDSKAVSKRIRDIKNILEMRYGMEFVSQIYFSQSCLEGKEIFDKIKNDFIE